MPKITVTLPDGEVQTFELSDDKISVGRHADNQICIDDASVSGHHAEFNLTGSGYRLKDLGSTNGTRINGESVTGDKLLSNGDFIRFGKIESTYEAEARSSPGSKPMPEADKAEAKVADESVKPSSFANISPFTKKVRRKDSVGQGVMIFAVLAILVYGAAMAKVLLLKAP